MAEDVHKLKSTPIEVALCRVSSCERVRECVDLFRKNGIDNISLDLMIGIPGQTEKSLLTSLEFIRDMGVPHVSAYMLKLEEGTHFYKNSDKLDLPTELLNGIIVNPRSHVYGCHDTQTSTGVKAPLQVEACFCTHERTG